MECSDAAVVDVVVPVVCCLQLFIFVLVYMICLTFYIL